MEQLLSVGDIMIQDYLYDLRRKKDVTQIEVAKELGYDNPQSISHWERGIATPPFKKVRPLLKFLRGNLDTYKQMLRDDLERRIIKEI